MLLTEIVNERVNIDGPFYDQGTFVGRFKHFLTITDPRTALVSDATLDNAKFLLEKYRLGHEPAGTTKEQVLYAKQLYASAFHPDTGDKQNFIGRMSFQVPGGMAITGFMLQFYRTTPAVIFWQWVNQSFNALVNYTNRNAQSKLTTSQLGVAYVSATTSALVTAIGLKRFLEKRASTLLQRFVPFAAVAAANCINIPLMRQSEITDGIAVFDENGNKVSTSKLAAVKGISQVVFSRIVMAAPGMLLLPVVMERLEKYPWMKRVTFLHGPFQVFMVGCFLVFMVPSACALFPQQCSLRVSTMKTFEPESFKLLEEAVGSEQALRLKYVYFNKGL